MALTGLRPMLCTEKVEETIAFYTSKLGFTVIHAAPGWATLRRDQVEILFCLPNAHRPFEKPDCTGSFYINTDDVDGLWETLKEQAEVVYNIENFEYGMREFAVYDNNGYVLQFGQPVCVAVQ